jgi:CRISPR system Cascade subunit CasA
MVPSPFSLLSTPWLPVRRRSGVKGIVRPAEIASNFDDDPIVAFAWGRPDFDAASREFMIGLLATAFAPEDGRAFKKYWREPPSVAQLDDAFAPFADAFVLDGEGPRFGQDLDALADAEVVPVASLLIEAPGENTIEENKDLFQKRGQVEAFSRAAAAMALFALQTFAPSGGAGHRTSLRGGGPLTTLVAPHDDDSLWRLLWLNTPERNDKYPPARDAKEKIFPWLASTITSDGKPPRLVAPGYETRALAHILQAFWGMPRRIRLVFTQNVSQTPCALTGMIDNFLVTGFRRRRHGVMYHPAFEHDLSPYRLKEKELWLPIHPQPGGILYKDWPSVAGVATQSERPAIIVAVASKRLKAIEETAGPVFARLIATGFDMGKATARGFVETEMPLFFPSENYRDEFQHTVLGLVKAADLAASATRLNIRTALAGDRADSNAERFAALRESFFIETQDAFFELLRELNEKLQSLEGDPAPTLRALAEKWRVFLKDKAIALFEEAVSFDDLPLKIMERAVPARRDLIGTFLGYGGMGKKLFAALDLATPQPAKKPAKKSGKAT